MSSVTATSAVNPIVNQASNARLGTVASEASMLMLKKANEQEASTAVQLTEALLQPTLANLGQVGTQVNTYV